MKLSRSHNAIFLLLGDRHDTHLDEIAEKAGQRGVEIINLRGKTTLRELGALIHHLDILITNDSSPLHLAVALKKPLVALFGPTANWALCPPGRNIIALQSPAGCSPCYPFGRFSGCGKPTCMADLPVADVTEAVDSLLALIRDRRRHGYRTYS